MEPLSATYRKHILDKLCISEDDATPDELRIIEASFDLFESKIRDIRILEDRVRDLTIELANLRAMKSDD